MSLSSLLMVYLLRLLPMLFDMLHVAPHLAEESPAGAKARILLLA
jgi:hypothetical protein